MATKYDVFAQIIEKAPCKPKNLNFNSPIYAHLNKLIESNWVKKSSRGVLVPILNKKTKQIFEIIKWSLKNSLDPNIWFNNNLKKVLKVLTERSPKINPSEISANSTNLALINFFSNEQFILLYQLNPKRGTLLTHKMFNLFQDYQEEKINIEEKYLDFKIIKNLILKTKKRSVNPFGLKLFEFLTGSAQLEGGTITIGETVEILTKDIYPNKSPKDIQMVKNLNEAFGFILEHLEEPITLESIKELNKLCIFSLHKGAGQFKKSHNKIAGNPKFQTAHPRDVLHLLSNYCNELNLIKTRGEVIEKIGYIHNEFQHIHPFSDGNSRTTRLLVNWLLMKFQLPLLILKRGAFEKYMSLTKLSTKRNDPDLRNFLAHLIYHEELIKKCNN